MTCGVHSDGCAECWGYWVTQEGYVPPGEDFTTIALANMGYSEDDMQACALSTTGAAICWGGSNEYNPNAAPDGDYVAIAAGGVPAGYAVGSDGRFVGWGQDDACFEGTFYRVAASDQVVAATQVDGVVVLGTFPYSLHLLDGHWSIFAVASHAGCGIRDDLDGVIQCVSAYDLSEVEAPAEVTENVDFLDVCVTGDDEACALDASGIPICWNTASYYDDLLSPPPGPFTKITCGTGHACGLTAEGAIECWGDDIGGETTPPS